MFTPLLSYLLLLDWIQLSFMLDLIIHITALWCGDHNVFCGCSRLLTNNNICLFGFNNKSWPPGRRVPPPSSSSSSPQASTLTHPNRHFQMVFLFLRRWPLFLLLLDEDFVFDLPASLWDSVTTKSSSSSSPKDRSV